MSTDIYKPRIIYISYAMILVIILLSIVMPFFNIEVGVKAQRKPTVFDYIIRDPTITPGGTFKDPMMGEANTLNPWMFTTSWEFMILGVVYDTLTTIAPDGNIVGVLAKDWEIRDNGTTYIFYLYENATWHDGTPLTADDVVFTYLFLRDYGNITRFKDYAPYIKNAEALNKYTVKITLTQPYAPFLTLVTSSIFIVPKHIWSKISPSDLPKFKNEPPLGSGPFIFKEHVPQQYYKLEANPKYHLGRPYIDTYILPIISNPEAMLLSLKKGEIDDVTWSVPYATIPDLLQDPNIRIWNVTELGARFMYYNCLRYPMDETLFRIATHHALNFTEIVNIVYQGYALPGSLGRLPPILQPWYNPNVPPKEIKYPFNLTKASELLDQLGLKDYNGDGWRDYPNGTKISLTIYSPSYDPLRVRVGEILTTNLRKIGLDVKHQPLEWTTLVSKLTSGDFDMLIIGGIGSQDPDILRQLFAPNGSWNMGHCVVPGLDPLLQQQAVIPDIETRKQIVWKIQEILADYVPLLNFVHQQFVFAYRTDKWAGWILYPIASPDNWFSLLSLYNIQIQKPKTPIAIIYTPTPTATPLPTSTQMVPMPTTATPYTVYTSITTSVAMPTTIITSQQTITTLTTQPQTLPTTTPTTTPPKPGISTEVIIAVIVIIIVLGVLVLYAVRRKR